jgi:hypothetical protein
MVRNLVFDTQAAKPAVRQIAPDLAPQQTASLFDHRVGEHKEHRRDVEAQLLERPTKFISFNARQWIEDERSDI